MIDRSTLFVDSILLRMEEWIKTILARDCNCGRFTCCCSYRRVVLCGIIDNQPDKIKGYIIFSFVVSLLFGASSQQYQ